jgi:coproporphyrinogen III oxidase-like Fe-S oxidoreductase
MDKLMRDLIFSMDMEDIIEMLRELRELSEMSPSEREIYGLIHPDAQLIAECSKESLIASKEDVLMILN